MFAFLNTFVFWILAIFLFSCVPAIQEEENKLPAKNLNWRESQPGQFTMDFANVEITIDRLAGGRIIKLAIEGTNLLTGPSLDSINFGSTLWLSPQSLWRWPPPAVLDRQVYELVKNSDSLYLKSRIDDRFGVSFSKSFLASLQDTSLQITYGLHNHTDSVVSYAIWEVTRMHKDSEVYFSLEEENSLRSIKESFWVLDGNQVKISVLSTDNSTNKMYANGKGRLVYQKDSLALIKTYPDLTVDQLPPNHNEIEIYIDDTTYLEVEQHSPFVQLNPGEYYFWQVKWYPRVFSHNQQTKKWMDTHRPLKK